MSVRTDDTVATWADQWKPALPIDAPQPDPDPDRTPLGVALVVLLGFALAGAAYLTLTGALDSDPTSEAEIEAEVAGVDLAAEGTISSTANTPTTTDVPAATEAPTPTAAAVVVPSVDDTDVRTAVFSGGKVYLRGEVPSQDIADLIASRAGAVLGPENVVVEYVINPDAALPDSAPLYVDDHVLFEVDSSVINPGFVPLLELGTSLMLQNDSVTMTVIAHTDSVGSAEYNQTLSEDRAQAVKDFWIESGIAAERVEAIGKGESSPEQDNLVGVGRAANRRAEFIVHGILG